uniref:WIF domain-containing protein n=1 Tax=Panagrolaimus sp. PS1159 TaxID=55785 RepID=A0AC35FAD7_9BILA
MNYVEDGIVNAYSTKFPYRVGTNISHIIFSWNSKVSTKQIKYQIRAVAETFDVLPLIHLPLEGMIPTKTETFAVEYRCAGSRSGQFFVTLFFNISWPSESDPTLFTLKQEKICASRDGRRIVEVRKINDVFA